MSDFSVSPSPHDTIAAISTHRGEAAICVIRISGPLSLQILKKIFRKRDFNAPDDIIPRIIYHGLIVNPENTQPVDEVQTVFFANPNSYTGEDSVEVYGHGGVFVCDTALALVIQCGARLAERGEFTLRAFLNGKMDLSAAEAVLDVIQARSEKSLILSMKNLRGGISERIKPAKIQLLDLLASIEVAIEYPDDDFPLPSREDVEEKIHNALVELEVVYGSYRVNKGHEEAVRVIFIGPPNVGKSSLSNRLLGEQRSIVHSEPGTTRDVVKERSIIDGSEITIIDTAGIHSAASEVEAEGVRRTIEEIRASDIKFLVLDASEGLDRQLEMIKSIEIDNSTYLVLNKIDISGPAEAPESMRDRVIRTSALTGEGIEDLTRVISLRVRQAQEIDADAVSLNNRQVGLLERAIECLREAEANLNMPIDIVSIDIKGAASALCSITGDFADREMLNTIFSNYCVGK